MDASSVVVSVTPESNITNFSLSVVAQELSTSAASALTLLASSAQSPNIGTIQDAQRDRDNDRTGLDPNGPVFKKLLAGILFSRVLCFVYYVVVVGILLVFMIAHWGPRATKWIKSRKPAQSIRRRRSLAIDFWRTIYPKTSSEGQVAIVESDCDETESNASSSPPPSSPRFTNEATPLLSGHLVEPKDTRALLTKLWDRTTSWLCYQPASVPGFNNRVMPSNFTTIVMLIFLGINAFFLLFGQEFKVLTLFIFADRASQLFVTNLPILYLLSAKNQPFQPLIGYSYASLNIVHRRLGEWMCFLAACHGFGMIAMWATLLQPNGYTWQRFFGDSVVLFGLGTLTCYLGIYLTSLATVRQAIYEFFLASHILLQIAAMGFLWLHHSKSHVYISLSLGIWMVDRIICRFVAKTGTYPASIAILPDGETTALSVSIPLREPNWLRQLLGLKNLQNGWDTLDHVFLSIPKMGNKYALQSHPFSIASSPPVPENRNGHIELIIRKRGGFSKDLLTCAMGCPSIKVRLDGPYGTHSATRLLQESDARVIVAGGSGIAVAYPLLERLQHESSQWCDPERATPLRPILFIWVVADCKQWKWINKERVRALDSMPTVQIKYFNPTRQAGRPDLCFHVGDWIKTLNANRANKDKKMSFGVVVSGPDAMARDMRNGCAAMQAKGLDVRVEIEKYGW